MMIQRLILLCSLMLPIVSWSALPPSAESMRKIKAIAESPAVFEKLSVNDHVTGINEKETGYVVTTDRCKLYVTIQETDLSQIEPNLVGPPKLEVVLGDMKCQKGAPIKKRNIEKMEKTRATVRPDPTPRPNSQSGYRRRQY
jgi:hypothetical protein